MTLGNTSTMGLSRRFGRWTLSAFLLTVYILSSSGKFHIVDEVSLFAVTESLATRGHLDTNAIAWTQWVNSPGEVLGAFGVNGEVFSKKGPAPAVVAVPWYLMLRGFGLLGFTVGLLQSTLLWNAVVTAATAALLWEIAVRLGYHDRSGALLALIFGLATIAWPYANHFFGEPLSAFSLLLCFYGGVTWQQDLRMRSALLAGIGAAIAVATVTAHVLLILFLWLYLIAGWYTHTNRQTQAETPRPKAALFSGMLAFLAPLLTAIALLLLYNFVRFGNVLETGYHFSSGEGFTTPLFTGLWGLIGSPYRGIFWHTPILFASLLGIKRFTQRHPIESVIIAAMSLTLILLYSTWWMWWGGFAWGPRFLVPLTPFWVLALAPLLQAQTVRPADGAHSPPPRLTRIGLATIGLAIISMGVQILAVSVNYVNYEIDLRQIFPTNWEDPLQFGPPAVAAADFAFSPVIGQLRLIREGFVVNTDLAWLLASGDVHWLVLFIGGLALATLALLFAHWWRSQARGVGPVPEAPMLALLLALPLTLAAVWSGEVSTNPHYGVAGQGYRAIVEQICSEATSQDVIVTLAPFSYQVPMNWLPTHCRTAPPIHGYAKNSLEHPEAQQVLARALQEHSRVWLVTAGLPPSDPDNQIERRLSEVGFKAQDVWYDDYRLVRYGTSLALSSARLEAVDIALRDVSGAVVQILAARFPSSAGAGELLPVELVYQPLNENEAELHWFVQLLAPTGEAVALLDTPPDDGYRSFPQLAVGQEFTERAGLQIPAAATPGVYLLIAGLYNPDAAEAPRLRTPAGADHIELGQITILDAGVGQRRAGP